MSHHTFLIGDVREALATLPDESVNCVVTSPPYFGLRNYGLEPTVWGGLPTCAHEWKRARYYTEKSAGRASGEAFSEAGADNAQRLKDARWREDDTCQRCGAWRGDLGLESTPEMYVGHLTEIFREVRRVLRPDGTVWFNIGDSYNGSGGAGGDYAKGGLKDGQPKFPGRRLSDLKPKDLIGVPWRVAFALQADGWWLRSDIVWAKTAPMPESVTDRPTRAHEYVFLLTKSQRYHYDAEAVAELSVSGDPRPPQGSDTIRTSGEPHPNKGARERGPGKWGVRPVGIPGEYEGRGRSPKVGEGRLTRNMRDVWMLGPEPFSAAHFATFPTEIPRRAIKAGCPERVCSKCGAPWARVIARSARSDGGRTHSTTEQRLGRTPVPEKGWQVERTDLGLRPTCSCENAETRPGVVLDPFGGSGTTSLVAKSLNRDSIYIDLNETYADMAVKRCDFNQQTLHIQHTHEVVRG